jgi:hypothetical protein
MDHVHGALARRVPAARFARPGLAWLMLVAALVLLAGAIDPIVSLF